MTKMQLTVNGKTTVITMEGKFWREMFRIAGDLDISLDDLASQVVGEARGRSMASSLRTFVLANAVAGSMPEPEVMVGSVH